MADLVVGLAKSVVDGALTKAQAAIEEEAKLRKGAQRDLVFISGEFQMMKSFLNVANAERVKNPVVRTWVGQVRELAYDVEDCIELVVHLDGKTSWTWLRRMVPSCMAPARNLDNAVDEIEQLKARVVDVSKRNARYSLISDSGSKPAVQQAAGATEGTAASSMLMLAEAREATKRQPDVGDLAQLITKKGGLLQVISVWGSSGDHGMTSIIRKAYSDPEIGTNFTCRAWVKLTHPFNPDEFVRCLVAQFHANSCQGRGEIVGLEVLKKMKETEENLLKEFKEKVNERYLVVLEDVSNMVEWDAIRTFLPDKKNGSWIIVSTQQSEVASLCIGQSYEIEELKQFSPEHSVCALYEEVPQGDGDKAEKSVAGVSQVSQTLRTVSGDQVLSRDKETACDWIMKFPLVGRASEKNELRKYIANAHINSVQVMSVWGIAGVGKSALVRNLYYYKMHKDEQFEKYSWVDLSHPFNLRDFSRSLLGDFHSDKDPIKECHRLLRDYRCLIVIDDLETKEEWDMILAALVSRPSKSVIIVITTEARIATYCADNEELVFNVKGLEADAAFDLFKKEVSRKNPMPASMSPGEISALRELTLMCGGLPKVIVAIAGLLTTKTVGWMETANSINDKFMKHLETNPEFNSLQELFSWMNSYFRTCPDSLKPCIFYLSIFPREYIIRRRRLVRRWIAEGYSRDSHEKSAEEEGEKFFSKLLDLSIIQQPPQFATTTFNDTRMVLCQVNGFIREYIVSRQMEENLVFELGGSCSLTTQRTGRHLIILEDWDRDRIVFENIDFSRLRSLTVFGKWKSFYISESMKLLRVLDLEDAVGLADKDLEQMVKLLPRLKFLSLRGCSNIFHLPSSFGDLRQLQTLDVRNTSIAVLPANIIKLQKLQYIRAGTAVPASTPLVSSWLPELVRCRRIVGVEVPRGIGKLTALHTLGVVNVSASGGKTFLKDLKKVTQLGKLGVSGINRNNSKKLFSAISGHGHMESLSLQLEKGNQDCSLENLKSLKLYGLADKLPGLGSNQLSKIEKLDLEMATLYENTMAFLGKLPKLCILRVKQLQGGKLDFCVMISGMEENSYQKVKILEFACSSLLHVTFGSKTMKSLELLKVDLGGESSYQLSGLNYLSELKSVMLKGSNDEESKTELQRQLEAHPKRPVVMLEKLPRLS